MLGLAPHDLDFTVVAESFEDMKIYLISQWGVEIFLEKPEYGTIRGRFTPYRDEDNIVRSRYFSGITLGTLAADFVLSRREGYYTDGRHPDETTPGSLYDDLARRDFTVNAIALDKDGKYIDPFGGRADLEAGVLDTVGVAEDRFREDALRLVRAMRFAITKNFTLSSEVERALGSRKLLDVLVKNVATDRVREETKKCFEHSTSETLTFLSRYPSLASVLFSKDGHDLWLMPTQKVRY
jgi:tRNA nucleotidyltransferase/poly(A) polymerase